MSAVPVDTLDRARSLFRARFGREPRVIASSAGRVNLIGEHTDYNGGEVLPIAIDRRTYVAIDCASGDESRAVSENDAHDATFTLASPKPAQLWTDYVAGTCHELAARVPLPRAIDIAVTSDVPLGSGLSSSAALEVATASAVAALVGAQLPARELALAGFRAENDFVGMPCGIMDQFASALGAAGQALHVWCDTGDIELVPMPDAVMIFDTAVPRSLRSSAFATRRDECQQALALIRARGGALASLEWLARCDESLLESVHLPDPLDRRARHVVRETRRVAQTVAVLRHGEVVPGDLLVASHHSLRDDYECSSPGLDWFVEHAMREPGVRGARLTGAGWGGCAIALGEAEALANAAPRLAAAYRERFNIEARVWITRASEGARVDDVRSG